MAVNQLCLRLNNSINDSISSCYLIYIICTIQYSFQTIWLERLLPLSALQCTGVQEPQRVAGVVYVEVEGDAPHDDQPEGELHYLSGDSPTAAL